MYVCFNVSEMEALHDQLESVDSNMKLYRQLSNTRQSLKSSLRLVMLVGGGKCAETEKKHVCTGNTIGGLHKEYKMIKN